MKVHWIRVWQGVLLVPMLLLLAAKIAIFFTDKGFLVELDHHLGNNILPLALLIILAEQHLVIKRLKGMSEEALRWRK